MKQRDMANLDHPYHRAPRGMWLGASYALGRPVPVGEDYPHICHLYVTGWTGTRFKTQPRDCPVCAEIKYQDAMKENG